MTGPVLYEHLPTVKAGFQYDGTNGFDIALWANGKAYMTAEGLLIVRTKQGEFVAHVGDVVMAGSEGEYYPCPPEIHALEYRAMGERS